MLDDEAIVHRFTNHPPAADVAVLLDGVTEQFIAITRFIAKFTPECREQSLAITNLEQASMWTKAAIARHQREVPA